MTSWIDHVQRFVASGEKDQAALQAARAECNDQRILEFLSEWPFTSKEADERAILLAKTLAAERQEAPGLMLRFMVYLSTFRALQSPLKVPTTQREPLFRFAHAVADQLRAHRELLPSAGLLHLIRGTGLDSMRDFVAALAAYEEALDVYRQLDADQPGVHVYYVAAILNNLGALLSELRDFPAARTACEEALDIYRELATDQPAEYLPNLAASLNNLGMLLSDMREFPAARTTHEEAVAVYRQLAASKPAIYVPSLALSLNNLGNLLRNIHDFPAARAAYEEVLDIYRQLAATQPADYLPDVARTLNNLGALLIEVREFSTARAAYEEALKISRQLAADQPAVYMGGVASTLTNLSALLGELREFPAAHKACVEALDTYRQLAADQPAAYLPRVAGNLNNLANLLKDMRELSAARTAYEEALIIYRELAVDEPAVYIVDVASGLNSLGSLLNLTSEFSAARSSHEEALNIYRQLAADQPSVYVGDVAGSLSHLGNQLRIAREFPAAYRAYEEALEIYRQLAADQPTVHVLNVISALDNLGTLLRDMCDLTAARAAYEEAVELVETPHSHRYETFLHLEKIYAHDAYLFLLAEAVESCANEKAFAYSASIRDGQARSGQMGLRELRETQDWLKRQREQSGIAHRLLVASFDSGNQLVLGLIDEEDSRFVSLNGVTWQALFPSDHTIEENRMCRCLARELWEDLPNEFQVALAPARSGTQFIAISGDPFWSVFPWELLRFGDGEDDYLGLHHALPRIGAIQAKDLQAQLCPTTLGRRGGRTAVLAPFDTGLSPLIGVVDEINSVKRAVESRGGSIAAFAKGSTASDLEIERQIELQPDVFYYSGHGTIVQNQELLVLHRDMSALQPSATVSYFGKEHLALLSQHRQDKLFPQSPLIVLNSCSSGRVRRAGGAREDLISAFLAQGAGAIIATALPLYDAIGKALGEALFDPCIANSSNIADVIVGTRRRLAKTLCAEVESPYWGGWSMIHLHGNARATMPFNLECG